MVAGSGHTGDQDPEYIHSHLTLRSGGTPKGSDPVQAGDRSRNSDSLLVKRPPFMQRLSQADSRIDGNWGVPFSCSLAHLRTGNQRREVTCRPRAITET